MAYKLASKCEILLTDTPPIRKALEKYNYPAINHTSAYNYAKTADKLIDFSNQSKESKPAALLYHRVVSHTLKHIIHKYKRGSLGKTQYKVWAVTDFYTGQGGYSTYVTYPRILDLYALKKEVHEKTAFHIPENPQLDQSLDKLNIGALCDLKVYKNSEFKMDFDIVQVFWESALEFVKNNKLN
jgi:hypothetical protein